MPKVNFIKRGISSFLNLGGVLEHKRANLIKENGFFVLDETIKFLESNNIYYWVDAGTMLGIIRDNDFIENDTDIDIAIVIKDADTLYELLLEHGYNIWYFYTDSNNKKTLIRAEKESVGIDFEIFYKEYDNYYYDASRDLPSNIERVDIGQRAILRYEFQSAIINELTTFKFKNIDIKVPKDYDTYFLVYYSNWKVKTKKTAYLKSYFSQSVDKYTHHNKSAYYLKDKYLYFTQVNKSTIRLTFKDIITSLLKKG